jgi:predicted nuclease of predicted toxin-antitoxin system
MIKFLADMGVSQGTVRYLRSRGYDVSHLRDENLHRLPDEEIVRKAEREGRVILTFDLDFGAIMVLLSDQFPSIVIFRLSNARPDNVNKHIDRILAGATEALESGAIFSVEDDRYRIRRLPIE